MLEDLSPAHDDARVAQQVLEQGELTRREDNGGAVALDDVARWIQPQVAQIMVSLGVDIGGVMTLRSLREGLRYSLHVMGYRVVAAEA